MDKMNSQKDILNQKNKSNHIILNSYSIQNLIINPINFISNEIIPIKTKNQPKNSKISTPKNSLFHKTIKYTIQHTGHHKRRIPMNSTNFLNTIVSIDLDDSTNNKRNINLDIIPKFINLAKTSNSCKKFPQDSIKKTINKNYIDKIEIGLKKSMKNALSQDSIYDSGKKEKHKDKNKNKIKDTKIQNSLSIKQISTIVKPNSPKIFTKLIKSNEVPQNSKIKQIFSHNNPTKLILKEFIYGKPIGKGTYGNIFEFKWIKNNKFYALKKEILKDLYDIQNRKKAFKIIQEFINKTKNKGIINLYCNLCYKVKLKNNNKEQNINNNDDKIFYEYYELMEKADKDWENEISERRNKDNYYTEKELLNIMKQLITTLSLMQKNHITHRDIKPQNVLILDGKYKLCDFGETRKLERDGLIVQRVRGSELYMSTILFQALHNNLIQVKHNTYKSDVFSLGMCLFYAASLTYGGVDSIRELSDMNEIKNIIFIYLAERYSEKLILLILSMLEIDENKRPNFIELEEMLKKDF